MKRIDLHHLHWAQRNQRGQSLVEMAFVLPFLVLMLLGTVEFGYYVYTYSELENATRRASEFASKTPPFSSGDKCAELAKNDALTNVFLSDKTDTEITVRRLGPRKMGEQIEVVTTYQGQFLTSVAQQWFGDELSFEFTSRRTITSVSPPFDYEADCSPK